MSITASYKNFANHFEALFKHAPMVILVTNNTGKIVAINPEGVKKFGYSGKELEGENIEMLIPKRFSRIHAGHHRRYLQNPKSRTMGKGREIAARKKNGTEFMAEIKLSSYKYKNEQFVIAFITDQTAKRKEEQKVKEILQLQQQSEAQYRQILNNIHDSFILQRVIRNRKGKITDLLFLEGNKVTEKLFGRKIDEITGHTYSEVMGPPDPEIIAIIEKAVSSKRVVHGEIFVPAINRWLNYAAYCPKPGLIAAFSRDITLRKQTDEKLKTLNRELENKIKDRTKDLNLALQKINHTNQSLEEALSYLNAVLQHAGAMIIVCDINGKIRIFNPAAEKSLGYSAKEVIGKHSPVLFHCPVQTKIRTKQFSAELGEKIKPGFQTYIAKARRNHKYEDEWNYVRKDGSSFPVSLIVTTLRNHQNRITGYMGVAVDISERKNAERELLSVTNLLKDIINNYPDGSLAVADKDFNYLFAGGEAINILGLSPGKMIGRRLFPLVSDQNWELIEPVLKNVFSGEHVTDCDIPQLLNGHHFTFDAFPLRETDGSVKKIAVMTRNISELKKIQEDLEIALQKERELSELKSRFVSMASHEFRTPLSTILSSANLLERYTAAEDQPKRDRHIQNILSAVTILTDTLNDFLSVGKIEEGKISIKPAELDITELVTNVSEEMTAIVKPGQQIKVIHKGSKSVFTDPSLLRHILVNLVSNASKFSPENTIISITTNVKNNCLTLSVKDQGIGISNEDQKHLMERFFRGSNTGDIQGTGLGLHIVSKYAELMNGIVKCKSELNKGTEFIVLFNKKPG